MQDESLMVVDVVVVVEKGDVLNVSPFKKPELRRCGQQHILVRPLALGRGRRKGKAAMRRAIAPAHAEYALWIVSRLGNHGVRVSVFGSKSCVFLAVCGQIWLKILGQVKSTNVYKMSANLVQRELRNATFEGKSH